MYTYYGKKNIKCALIAHVVVGIVNLTVVSCSLLVLLPYCGVGVLASIITSSVVDMSGSTLCCSSSPLRASCLVDQVHVPLLPPWRYPSTIKCDHNRGFTLYYSHHAFCTLVFFGVWQYFYTQHVVVCGLFYYCWLIERKEHLLAITILKRSV